MLTLHQHRNSWKAGAQEDDTDLVKLRRADAWLHLGAGIGCHLSLLVNSCGARCSFFCFFLCCGEFLRRQVLVCARIFWAQHGRPCWQIMLR